jgi:hypothetical protein
LLNYFAKLTLFVSQFQFANSQSPHCYLAIWRLCQVDRVGWFANATCQVIKSVRPIVKSMLPSLHSRSANSTSPRQHCQIAKSTSPNGLTAQMSFKPAHKLYNNECAINGEWTTSLHGLNKFMDDISWMNFISSQDFMNFHRWTSIALGSIQSHIIHTNEYKDTMKFELETFEFSLNMFEH